MKVKELIEILQKADENFEVKITDFEGSIMKILKPLTMTMKQSIW